MIPKYSLCKSTRSMKAINAFMSCHSMVLMPSIELQRRLTWPSQRFEALSLAVGHVTIPTHIPNASIDTLGTICREGNLVLLAKGVHDRACIFSDCSPFGLTSVSKEWPYDGACRRLLCREWSQSKNKGLSFCRSRRRKVCWTFEHLIYLR
jgi:hypothetical protein